MEHHIRTGRRWAVALIAATAAIIAVMTLAIFSAHEAKAQWTGCAIGGFGGHGAVTSNSGDGISGHLAGVSVGCDLKIERFVVGAEASYGWIFGDLKKEGAATQMDVMARAGFLVTPAALLYAHGGWGRMDAGSEHVNAWKAGLGSEFKVPERPLFLDLRWTHGFWDDTGPDTVRSDEFRLGFKIKLGPDFMPAPEPAVGKNSIK